MRWIPATTLAVATALASSAWAQSHTDHQGAASAGAAPTEPGQGAFAAIHEIVERLMADPQTNWEQVNINRLREHLIDMEEVTLRATLRHEDIPGGQRIHVSGEGRTRQAIQNMIIGHANAMGDAEHWTMRAERANDGALVMVMAKRPSDLAQIRALGLIGLLSTGSHHQVHHLMLATGERPHH